MDKNNQRGAITLEACVSVLAFVLLMLMLSSLFIMFMAQNVTAHVTLQTAQSLSMEAYSIEKLRQEDGELGTVGGHLTDFITGLFGTPENKPGFVMDYKWYDAEEKDVPQAVKTRFVGYLSGGDQEEADRILKQLNVVEGLEGLDFSGSKVQDGVLYVVLKYKLEYDFNVWELGVIDVEQEACSKLWK